MTPDQNTNPEILDKWNKDPSNWKWGVFYYNKNDKRLFPPKRIKQFGWTVNFANPISILALLTLVILIAVLAGFLRLLWKN